MVVPFWDIPQASAPPFLFNQLVKLSKKTLYGSVARTFFTDRVLEPRSGGCLRSCVCFPGRYPETMCCMLAICWSYVLYCGHVLGCFVEMLARQGLQQNTCKGGTGCALVATLNGFLALPYKNHMNSYGVLPSLIKNI